MKTNNSALAETFRMLQKQRDENEEDEIKKFNTSKYDKARKLVRDEFKQIGKYKMPLVRKQDIDLDTIDLLNYTKATQDDTENTHKTIHFFTYDWLFDAVYENPEKAVERFKTLPKSTWDLLRKSAYFVAENKCTVCGKESDLEAHEVWDFDIPTRTQTLVDIVALCTACHGVKHFRHSQRIGYAKLRNYDMGVRKKTNRRRLCSRTTQERKKKDLKIGKRK
jgi:hypothetical protein